MNTDRLWTRFVELLSLDLHDGDGKLASERPCKNVHGSIASYKKFFDQAVADLHAADLALRTRSESEWQPKATEPGFCPGCGCDIAVGEELTWWGWYDPEQTKRKFVHRKCPRKFDLGGEG